MKISFILKIKVCILYLNAQNIILKPSRVQNNEVSNLYNETTDPTGCEKTFFEPFKVCKRSKFFFQTVSKKIIQTIACFFWIPKYLHKYTDDVYYIFASSSSFFKPQICCVKAMWILSLYLGEYSRQVLLDLKNKSSSLTC